MTKQTLTLRSINLIPINTDTSPGFRSDLYIDAGLLVQRVNALIQYSGELESENTAEKHAREISTLMKTLKDILTHNKAIEKDETSTEQTYTLVEEEVLAAELAELIAKNGGIF